MKEPYGGYSWYLIIFLGPAGLGANKNAKANAMG